jgi:protein-disulfide isomerase
MNVPANWTVIPEEPKPGSVPGYDDIDIRFGSGSGDDQQQIVRFLLSKDRQHLAKLSSFALNDLPVMKINTAGRPVSGPQDAAIEIVDFDDLQCPFCARLDAKVLPDTMSRYNGLVKVVYKDFPLTSIHPWAMHAAVNANCLAAQSSDAYWNFVHAVHAQNVEITGNNRNIDVSLHALDTMAEEKGRGSGLDLGILKVCVAKQDQSDIQGFIQEGEALRVNQTPTLFIAGERLMGLPTEPMLWATIDRALKAKGLVPPQ